MTLLGRGSRLGRGTRAGRRPPFFVSAEAVDVPTPTNAYAHRATNSILHARPIAVNPVNDDVFQAYYKHPDLQVVVRKQIGGTGAFTETLATATICDATDDHCSLKMIVDDQQKLCIWLGSHSDQERYYELAAGSTVLSETQRVNPRVPGGGALEAFATYHDPVRLVDGAVAVLWRNGGSGNGNNYVDIKRAGTWVRKPIVLNGTTDNVSFYPNTFVCEGAASRHPNRLWIGFQCRPSTDPATAFGLWLIYSDDEGTTWRAWSNGSLMPTGARLFQLGPALVENVPDAYTDPAYSYYYGLQGMCVGLDGCPVITMYYAPATPPAGNYGSPTGHVSVYGWRCDADAGSYIKQTLRTFTEPEIVGLSRPTPLVKGNILYVFFSNVLSDGSSRMSAVAAYGPTLASPTTLAVFGRNFPIDAKDADFCFDRNTFAQGTGPLYWHYMKAGATGTTTSNSPVCALVTFPTAQPTIKAPPEIVGANALDWAFDPDDSIDDGTGHASQGDDSSGNSRHRTQPTSASRPAILTGYDGHKALRYDGSNDWMSIPGGLSRPAPDASNKLRLWGIFTMRAWVSGDRMMDINGALIFQSPSGVTIRINHGTSSASATGLSAGLTRKVSALFTGSASDTLQVNDGTPGFGNSGATITGTQVIFGAGNGGGLPAQIDEHYICAIRRDFTAWETWQINNYAKLRLPTYLV